MAGPDKQLPFEYWEMLKDGREQEFYQHAIGFVLTSDHMWCEHGDVMAKLLPLFLDHIDGIDVVLSAMAEQFEKCIACVTAYHNTKAQLKDTSMLAGLQTQDTQRIINSLQKWVDQPEYLSIIFYEVLHFPAVLDNSELNNLFATSLLDIQKDNDLSFSGDKKIPGLYLLLMHPEVGLRFWAQNTVNSWSQITTLEEFELILPILEKCVHILQFDIFDDGQHAGTKEFKYSRKEFWAGFSFFLKQFSSELLEHGVIARFPELIDIIMNHLNEDSNIFWNALTCFLVLVDKLGTKLWSLCTFKPSFVLRTIFEQCTKTQDEKIHKACFQLFESVLGSLVNSTKSDYVTQRDDVLRFLTDKVDKIINFSSTSKVMATATAWKILQQGTRLNPPSIPYGSVNNWGPRLVQHACSKAVGMQSIMKLAVSLLSDILSSATIQMRECVLNLLSSDSGHQKNIDWWCGHLWSSLLSAPTTHSLPFQLHILIFRTYKCIALLDVSSILDENGDPFAQQVNSALGKYRQDLYSYLTATSEKLERGLIGHEELINSVFYLLASPDKLVRASVTEFLRMYSDCGEAAGTMAVVIQYYTETHPKALFDGLLSIVKEVYCTLGVSNCVKSMDNLFFWAERTLVNLQKMIKENGFRVKNEKGETVVACGKAVAKNIIDYMWFTIEDTLRSVKLESQTQLFRIRFLEFINQFILMFATFDFPSFTKLKAQYQDDDLEDLDGTIIQNHDRWMKYFIPIGQMADVAVITRWFQCLISIIKAFEGEYIKLSQELSATCSKILTKELAPSITDAQRAELGKRMPAVGGPIVGNLGMDWHSSLPSFEKAKAPATNTKAQPDSSLPSSSLAKPKSKATLKQPEEKDPRPLCWYGALCYRKNPDHLKQFRHPGDPVPQKEKQEPPAKTKSKADDKKIYITGDVIIDLTDSHELEGPTPNSTTSNSNLKSTTTTKSGATSTTDTKYKADPIKGKEPTKPTHSTNLKLPNDASDSEVDSDLDGPSKKAEDDAVAYLAQDVALAQYKLKMWKEKNEAKLSRQAKILELPSHQTRRVGSNKPIAQPEIKARTLEDLYKVVLSWDYDNLSAHKDESKMQRVPKEFNSAAEYINIFEPLLMEEILSQIEKGKEEADSFPIQMRIISAGHVNDFVMVDLKKLNASPHDPPLSDHDIVLITPVKAKKDKNAAKFTVLGKLEKKEKEKGDKVGIDARVRLFLQSGGKFVSERAREASKELQVNTVWSIKKIMSITTSSREFTALHTCRNLPLLNAILQPSLSPSSSSIDGLPGVLGSIFKSKFNPSQLAAIEAGVAANGFALLQGPPGTGKTRTIIGLISALLQVPPILQSSLPHKGYFQRKEPTKKGKVHILVSAPSNAAVDEIVLRLSEGVWDADGHLYKPTIVRVGNPSHVHVLAQKFCLENILGQKMAEDDSDFSIEQRRIAELRKKIESTFSEKNQMNSEINVSHKELEALREADEDELSLTTKLTDMHRKKDKLNDEIGALKTYEKQSSKKLDQVRRDMMAEILDDADIVCCTLSSSGSDIFTTLTHGFDAVVIDEAAQAIEVSSLIPLKYGVKKCIMVGDPNQLPATVLSTTATKFRYEQSLFQRMMEAGYHVHMLSVQYRMHPMIRIFPSNHFYEGKLTDGENVSAHNYIKPYHEDPRYAPFVFFNIENSKEVRQGGGSLKNIAEANFVYSLVHSFFQNYPYDKNISIGVITPYKQQYHELKRLLSDPNSKKFEDNLEINTVDGFQGREKDIIIFSCVRAHSGGIGFLADIRRMNVALTRARFSLLVVGHSPSLTSNSHWGALVDDAIQRSCYINVGPDFYKKPPSRLDLTIYMPMFASSSSPSKSGTLRKSSSYSLASPLKTPQNSPNPIKTAQSSANPIKTAQNSAAPLKTSGNVPKSSLKSSSSLKSTSTISAPSPDNTNSQNQKPSSLKSSTSFENTNSQKQSQSTKRLLTEETTTTTFTPNKKLKNEPLPNVSNKSTISKPQTNTSKSSNNPPISDNRPNLASKPPITSSSKPIPSSQSNAENIPQVKKSYNPGKTKKTIMINIKK